LYGSIYEYFKSFNASIAFDICFIPSPVMYFMSSTWHDIFDLGLLLTEIILSIFFKNPPLVFLHASNPIIIFLLPYPNPLFRVVSDFYLFINLSVLNPLYTESSCGIFKRFDGKKDWRSSSFYSDILNLCRDLMLLVA
jgi:hypothetical protein